MIIIYYKVIGNNNPGSKYNDPWLQWACYKYFLKNNPGLCGYSYLSTLKKGLSKYNKNNYKLIKVDK